MSTLAKREVGTLTPREELSREVVIRPEGDEDFRFSIRKLGNIHLGVKVVKQTGAKAVEYPKATEYFVLPEPLVNDLAFRAALDEIEAHPERPTRLPIMLMSDSLGPNLVTSCDLYGAGGKLKCRSYDGRTCTRLNPTTLKYEDGECKQSSCPDYEKGDCAWYHRLRFLLPDAAGLGYWQIATKSDNNRGALLREMNDIRKTRRGSLAGVDLMLTLTNEREFHVPVADKQNGGSKMITTRPYLLHLNCKTTLRELLKAETVGDTYEAEAIEESMDLEEVSVPEEIDMDTGEIVEITPITAAQATELKRLDKAKCGADRELMHDTWTQTLGRECKIKDLSGDEARMLIEALNALPDADTSASAGEFDVGYEADV